MEDAARDTLKAMFPDYAPEALDAVLQMSGGDVGAATNFLLGEEAVDEAHAGALAGAVPGGAGADDAGEGEDDDDEEAEVQVEDDDDEDAAEEEEEEEEEEDEEEEPIVVPPPAKRLRIVEPSDPASQKGMKVYLTRFDDCVLSKTHLEL